MSFVLEFTKKKNRVRHSNAYWEGEGVVPKLVWYIVLHNQAFALFS